MAETLLAEHPQLFAPVAIGKACVLLPNGETLPVPGQQVIVNLATGEPISHVSDKYQLVSNETALRYALICCREAFGGEESEWRIASVRLHASGRHCQIDLAHSTKDLNFSLVEGSDVPDVYGPFVRMVNSYDRSRAFSLSIGFMRKICSNGMVLEQSAIRFYFDHKRKDIKEQIQLEVKQDHFRNLRTQFVDLVKPLHDCQVPSGLFQPIMRSALRIEEPDVVEWEDRAHWAKLGERVESVCDTYARDLGENAYAVMNAMSDFATRPTATPVVHRSQHTFQSLAGAWLSDFSAKCARPGFSLEDYVKALEGDREDRRAARHQRQAAALPRTRVARH